MATVGSAKFVESCVPAVPYPRFHVPPRRARSDLPIVAVLARRSIWATWLVQVPSSSRSRCAYLKIDAVAHASGFEPLGVWPDIQPRPSFVWSAVPLAFLSNLTRCLAYGRSMLANCACSPTVGSVATASISPRVSKM